VYSTIPQLHISDFIGSYYFPYIIYGGAYHGEPHAVFNLYYIL